MKKTDSAFFLDYERVSHHKSMMSDSVRVQKYKKAIQEVVRVGDVVVDLGAGTGILSLIAAKSGARTVYAIERTDMIHVAQKIASDNGIDNIVFIQADSSEIQLPEKCDVLLSECLGYLVVQENMITDFLEFRDRWLKRNGRMIPTDASIYFAPVENSKAYESVSFWDTIEKEHEFNYSALRNVAANSTFHEHLALDSFLSVVHKAHEFDFTRDSNAAFKCEIDFLIDKSGILHGVGGYFISTLSPSITLDTSPRTKTHWRQHFFPLHKPLAVTSGDKVFFTIEAILSKALVDWIWSIRVNREQPENHDTRYGIRLKEKM